MQQLASNKTLLFIAVLIILGGAYWYFFTGSGEEPSLSSGNAPTSQAQIQFETLISELQPISFPTAIFSDPRFNVLVDLTTPIAPETAGRQDPFAVFR